MEQMDTEMEITNEMVSNEKVINQLKKLFHNLDLEIIESVAYECNYDMQAATNHLLDISNDIAPTVANDLIDLDDSQNNETPAVSENTLTGGFTTSSNRQNTERDETMHEEAFARQVNQEYSMVENPKENEAQSPSRTSLAQLLEQNLQQSNACSSGAMNLRDMWLLGAFNSRESEMQSWSDASFAQMLQQNSFGPETFNFEETAKKYEPMVKSRAELNVERIIADAKRGVKILILLRGLPGSGKSYLANKIVQESIGVCDARSFILSADDYFNRNGAYIYDKAQVQEAHRWAQKRALNMLTQGISPVIIDNTNTQVWEMKPYCVWAVDNSYAIEVLEPITDWAFNERELSRRNIHNVPKARIRHMLDRYERGVSVEYLFEKFNLCYRKKLPPQPRQYPKIQTRNPNVDQMLSGDGASLDSWSVLEPSTDSSQTKEISTMTGDKNPDQGEILVKDDFVSAPLLPYKWPRDGFLDKSTVTEDAVETNIEIENLSKLFQGIPIEYLKDVYEKCQHDIDWTLDILLADKKEIIQNYNPPPPKEIPKEIKIEETTEEIQPPVDPPKKIKQGTSEIAASLKKSLETSVVINHEHYSDHLKKIKKMDIPGTSKTITYSSSAETVIIDSDEDLDDSSYEAIDFSDDSSDSQEEMMELKVGDGFIGQLNSAFGDASFDIPDGIQTVIELPVSLGRQLYALWLESLFKQMDMQSILMEQMIKEDEEFAKKLQEQELLGVEEETPDLKQIMKEQYHLSRQKRAVDEWKNLTPDDLAYKLTVQKLCINFPESDLEVLVEILAAHNNCYKDTVESLILSGLKQESEVDITEPVNESLLMDMKVSHQSVMTDTDDTDGKSASQLREEARAYLNKRQELLEKANSYYAKGMYPVALFYSELAAKQTRMYEKYNNLAAETFLENHFNQNNHFNTIDLHCLFVAEALVALDRFLDKNIMLLINENKKTREDLHIITGKGKNSPNRRPKIRPAVQKRLKERGIKMEKVYNSGLIRARITRNTKMTTSL